MEGHVFVHNKGRQPVESLSPQNLLDCVSLLDESYGDSCDGGTMFHALQYVKKYGIATDKSYPYQGEVSRYLNLRHKTSFLFVTVRLLN